MFYLTYAFAELRRRWPRTLLTALGLAVGVGLVVAVNALSGGLNKAQSQVLQPLSGLGTDMTVTRPLAFSTAGGPFASLTPSERKQLQKENGGGRLGFRNIAKPGHHFSVDRFTAAGQLGFSSGEVSKVAALPSVSGAAGSLTLNSVHIAGTVPKNLPPQSGGTFRSGGNLGPRQGGFGGGFNGPRNINFASISVTGIDPSKAGLAPMTPSEIVKGRYLSSSAYDAVLSTTYAESQGLKVGSKVTLGGKTFTVTGLSTAPIGGNSSDMYVPLSILQKIAPGWSGQITNLEVEATSGSKVTAVKNEITSSLKGAQVTTAADVAKRITGSLTDAKSIAGTLGTALEIVGLLAALLFALLLTLTSVARRTREIGTLRAVGWSKLAVVRQVALETLAQGVLGGIAGVILGLAAVAGINAAGWTLQASVAPPSTGGPFGFGRFGGGGFARAFGQAATAASTSIRVHASVDIALLGLAIGLAVLGGLIAGSIGGFRASALRPATALRNIE